MEETDNTTIWVRRSIILILALGAGGMLLLHFDQGCVDLGSPSGNSKTKRTMVDLTVNGWPVVAHVADTPELREGGMKIRQLPGPGHGILYVWDESSKPLFWMKGRAMSASVAFMKADGTISGIYQLEAQGQRRVEPETPAKYALEIRKGFFEDHQVKEGDVIAIPDTSNDQGADR